MSTRTRIAKLELELASVQKALVGVQKTACCLARRALLGDELKDLNDEAKVGACVPACRDHLRKE